MEQKLEGANQMIATLVDIGRFYSSDFRRMFSKYEPTYEVVPSKIEEEAFGYVDYYEYQAKRDLQPVAEFISQVENNQFGMVHSRAAKEGIQQVYDFVKDFYDFFELGYEIAKKIDSN